VSLSEATFVNAIGEECRPDPIESEAEVVAEEPLTHLICERLHSCLVRKCASYSLERCDSARKSLRPQSARASNRPGVPSQGQSATFPPT